MSRIAVVADTHVGDVLPVLPPGLTDALRGMDLILHAGDVVLAETLDRLRAIAPVVAVQGNHDEKGGLGLPRAAMVTAHGQTIGVVHGHEGRVRELPAALTSLALGHVTTLGLESRLAARLGRPDVLVFGHLHVPIARRVGRTLVFSPGSVYVAARDPGYRPVGLLERMSRRFRAGLPRSTRQPAVGIIEITDSGVSIRRRTLATPIRPATVERRGRAVRSPAHG